MEEAVKLDGKEPSHSPKGKPHSGTNDWELAAVYTMLLAVVAWKTAR